MYSIDDIFFISFIRIGHISIIYAHFFVFMGLTDIVFFFINDFKELELFTKLLKNQSENANELV